MRGLSVAPARQEPPIFAAKPIEHEEGRLRRRLREGRLAEDLSGPRRRRDHEAVPRGEDLVVSVRADAAGPVREEPLPRPIESNAEFRGRETEALRDLAGSPGTWRMFVPEAAVDRVDPKLPRSLTP